MKGWLNKRKRDYFRKSSMSVNDFIFVYFIIAIVVIPFLIGSFTTMAGITPHLVVHEINNSEKMFYLLITTISLYFFANEFSVSIRTKRVIYCYDTEGTPYLKRSIFRTLVLIHVAAIIAIPTLISLITN